MHVPRPSGTNERMLGLGGPRSRYLGCRAGVHGRVERGDVLRADAAAATEKADAPLSPFSNARGELVGSDLAELPMRGLPRTLVRIGAERLASAGRDDLERRLR